MNIYKYTVKGETFYLDFSDNGKFHGQRNSLDIDVPLEEIIAHLVHKLTATEAQASAIRSNLKIVTESLAVISDQSAKIRFGLS